EAPCFVVAGRLVAAALANLARLRRRLFADVVERIGARAAGLRATVPGAVHRSRRPATRRERDRRTSKREKTQRNEGSHAHDKDLLFSSHAASDPWPVPCEGSPNRD